MNSQTFRIKIFSYIYLRRRIKKINKSTIRNY